MAANSERLQKYLSRCGVASRRAAEELIRAGNVRVNGRVAEIGEKVDPGRDRVTVGEKKVSPPREKTYIMLNKPRGVVTTLSDEFGRKCVADLVAGAGERLFPVGRLDRDSEGLLFLTNDGEFANALTHPSRHVPKIYSVSVCGTPDAEQLSLMRNGVMLDGIPTMPCRITVAGENKTGTVLRFRINEGRNRQIRRMCEAAGLKVVRLKRVETGGVKLGDLPPGKWRRLTTDEIKRLREYQTDD